VGDEVINSGIFRMVNGSIETIAIPGGPANGAGPGVTFKSLLNLIAFNDDNLTATRVQLMGPGINVSNDSGLYLTWFGGFQLGIREGNAAPGVPGTSCDGFGFTMPLLGSDGQIAFDVSLKGATDVSSSRWRGWPGAVTSLAKEGDPTPEGGVFGGLTPYFWTMSLSDSGAAFRSPIETVTGAKQAIWHASGGAANTVSSLAVEGDLGPLGFYETIGSQVPNTSGDGRTIFTARFAAFGLPDAEDSAILSVASGEAAAVLLCEGDWAYGFGAGVEIDDVASFDNYAAFATNDTGWTLIRAQVRGPGINKTNTIGFWTIDPDGDIHYVGRTGVFLSFDGEPVRLVETISPQFGVGPQSGRRSSINNRGDVALAIRFTNGDAAVVVAQLPSARPGDINLDGAVDAKDLAMLLGAWGTNGPVGTGGDVDLDGDTDGQDLGALLGAWGPCRN